MTEQLSAYLCRQLLRIEKKIPARMICNLPRLPKLVFLLCFGALLTSNITAQSNHLLVSNPAMPDAFLFSENDYVAIRYRGYLGQETFCRGTVRSIDSAGICIAEKAELGNRAAKITVRIADITGMKKLSAAAEIGVSVLTIGTSLGVYFFAGSLGMHPIVPIVASSATGIAVRVSGIKMLRQDRMKYSTQQGWVIRHVQL